MGLQDMVVFNSRGWWDDWISKMARFDSFEELEQLSLPEVNVTAEGWRVLRNHAISDPVVLSELTSNERLDGRPEKLLLKPGVPVSVSFSSDLAFSHTFEMPRVARNNLSEIVELERARVTPFTCENSISYFAAENLENGLNKCRVSLLILHRDVLPPVILAIEAAGTTCAATFMRGNSGYPIRFAMALDGRRFHEARIQSLWKLVVICGCLALLGFALLLSAIEIRSDRMLATIERESQNLQADAQQVKKSLQHLRTNVASRQTLFAEQNASMQRVQVIEEMSRILPEDTFLVSLDVKRGQGNADGFALAPESLISLLEASPVLKNVQFNAPVIKSPNENKSSFSIKFDLEGSLAE